MKSRTQQEFAKKWVGVVKVKTSEKTVKFTSVDTIKDGKTEKVKEFPNGSVDMKVALADLPKIGKKVIKPSGGSDGKTFRIRLNEDGDGVEEVGPVSGLFKARLVELGPKKKDSEIAVPYVRWFKKGQPEENCHLEFFAVYEVTEGIFKGLRLPAFSLHYKFEGIPEGEEDEGMTRFDTVDSPKASQLHKLQEWAAVHGDILDEPIAWDTDEVEGVSNDVMDAYTSTHEGVEFANILPILEERALDNDREVNVVIERGYVKLVQAFESYEDESDEDDVDEAPSKAKDLADETEEEFIEKFPPVDPPKKLGKKVKRVSSQDDEDL